MKKVIVTAVLGILISFMASGIAAAGESRGQEAAAVLDNLSRRVSGALGIIDNRVAEVARALSLRGADKAKAGRALRWLCESTPNSIDCAFINREGTIACIEPAEYKRAEGADVSGHEVTIRVRETGKPFFSPVFRLVEGFNAAVLHHPVLQKGEYAGAVSFPVRLDTVLADQSRQALRGRSGFDVWLIQQDGLIVYDTNAPGIGLNLFTAPSYKDQDELLALGKRMATEKQGTGSYALTRGENEVIRKEAVWATVGMHGSEWRLLVTYEKER